MSKLYILCGAPGSGKSTFIQNHHKEGDVIVSRDAVRFSMVKEDEEYFSKEKAVFKEFIRQIDVAIDAGYDVFADATHLNPASRNKLLRSISAKPDSIEVVWIKTPLQECLERNERRAGTRSYVPQTVIRNMFNSIEAPSFEEGIDVIYIVEDNKPIRVIEKGD
jgi:predicted kinase